MHGFCLSVFHVAALYVGSVIGAGFASGQEILQFFIVYGSRGIWGAVFATALFSYLGGLVMLLSVTLSTVNYTDIYRRVLGRVTGRMMDTLSLAMLPGGIVVMLAGGGAVFSEHMGLPGYSGTLLTALITSAVIYMGLQGVISANAVLVPIKIAAIAAICLLALALAGTSPAGGLDAGSTSGLRAGWAWSAMLYVSYNMVVPVAVLSSLGRVVSLKAGITGGMLGGAVIGIVTSLVVLAGLEYYPGIAGYEVPLLYIAGKVGPGLKTLLGILIWAAILTTAIADTHGFASRFACSGSRRYRAMGIGVIFLSLPLSSLKFSTLVGVLYPIFGYGGLILLAALLFVPPALLLRRKFFPTV